MGNMRTFIIFLNGENIGVCFCEEDCDQCEQRFLCYTTNENPIVISEPTAKQLYRIQHSFQYKWRAMRCPHCRNMFKITNRQLNDNTKFKCPKCNRYNWGSCEADEYGILVGELVTRNV